MGVKIDAEKLTLRKIYLLSGTAVTLTAVPMLAMLYLLTGSMRALICALLFTVVTAFWFVMFALLLKKKVTAFSQEICLTLDGMMNGRMDGQTMNEEETLLSKINHQLMRLYEVMQENNGRAAKEIGELHVLISDISHQVKTPMANLKMVNGTLLGQNVPVQKQRELLQAVGGQLDKLDFLMQAMIKMSRLEAGVITLSQKEDSVYETLAAALGGIILQAEEKGISIGVDCSEDLMVNHDRKWTSEALFNILDNAVKYTESNGTIRITAVRWEFYAKIDIADSGRGIAENRQAEIFKRFYREEEVRSIEGIGIGLFLAREIITMQGGYIKVSSQPGVGSVFSVFLPNQ